MERSAAQSLVATFLRQRSEDLKACEMVIELKGKRLKARVIAVGVASNQQELASSAAFGGESGNRGGSGSLKSSSRGFGGGSGAELYDLASGDLRSDGTFSARFYIFKEDASGKRLLLHSSLELRRLEAITEIDNKVSSKIRDLEKSTIGGIAGPASSGGGAKSRRVLDSDVFDDDSIGLMLDFKNASALTFTFESEAQREAISSSIKRLVRSYGSIEQRQTILGNSALSTKGKVMRGSQRELLQSGKSGQGDSLLGRGAGKNSNGHVLGDDIFGIDGERMVKAKIEELKQDKQHGFGASDQRLLMEEMAKVAARLVQDPTGNSGVGGGGMDLGLGGVKGRALRRFRGRRGEGSAAVVRLFDNPHVFSEHLIDKMQRTELRVIRAMLSNEAIRSWENISLQAKMLGSEVENIQDRIDTYAAHIAGRKSSIEEIEHNIISAQRRERNFQNLHDKMEFLHSTLELTPEINATIDKLQQETTDVVSFFLNAKNTQVLSEAIRLTDKILHNGLVRGDTGVLAPPAELPLGAPSSAVAPSDDAVPIEEEFPIVAVVERKRYFTQMRRILCRSGKLFANSILEAVFRQMWTTKLRYSKNYRLVLQPHFELTSKLSPIAAIVCTMQNVDPEGYVYLLRKYREHKQRVYYKELTAFFDALRGCVKRLGWQLRSKNSGEKGETNAKGIEEQLRGPSLLGNSNNKLKRGDVFNHWAETNEASLHPDDRQASGGGMALWGGVGAVSEEGGLNLTPRGGVGSAPSTTTPSRPPLYGNLFSPSPTMPANYRDPNNTESANNGTIIYSNADIIGGQVGATRGPSAATAKMPSVATRGRSGSVASSNGESQKQFMVQVPELHKAVVCLHRPSAAQHGISAAAKAFQNLSAISKSIDKIKGSDGGGFLRPDIAFGMALEATIDIILNEEEALASIFGIYAPFMGGPGPKSSNTTPSPPTPPADRLVSPPHEISFNLQSSLRELFGGSTIVGPSKGYRRRPQLSKNSEVDINDDDASSITIANRKKIETNAKNPSLEWRHLQSKERRDTVFPTPKGTEIDSDFVSSEGEGSDSDDSDLESSNHSSPSSAALAARRKYDTEQSYTNAKERRKFLLERNVAKEQLYRLTKKLVRSCDRVYVPVMLCMVEAMLGVTYNTGGAAAAGMGEPLPRTHISRAQTSYFCVNILCKIHKKLLSAFERHLREQSRSIVHCAHKFILQPEALLPCFAHLALFIARLDATHDALDPVTCAHYHHYDTLVLTLVDHCFDVLDQLSHVKAVGSSSSTGISLLTLPHLGGFLNTIRAKIGALEEEKAKSQAMATNVALGTTKEVKRGFFMQLRHNALFCYTYNALSSHSHARALLQARYERCTTMRDRYEELYLTRSIFAEEMPHFSRFINMCTELVSAYTLSDLVHSKTLSRERMEEVLSKLEKEIVSGLKSSAARIKRHFTRDVGIDSPEEVFHRQLLKTVWGHFVAMVKNKIDFLNELLKWEAFKGLVSPISSERVDEVLKDTNY